MAATHQMSNLIKKINWSKYTPFQQRVFRTILKIPKGRVLTYGQVGKKMGNIKLARAIGNALAKNMDAPFIPCHRVIANNSLGGYSAPGGIRTKIKLLKREGYQHDS